MSTAEEVRPLDHDELLAVVREFIHQKRWKAIREALHGVPIPEVADLFPDLQKRDQILFFHALPRNRAADVFSYMELEEQNALLATFTDEDTRDLLADLRPDDRTQLLEELPGQVTQRLLNLLSQEDLKEARQLLGYPEESVGRLMTPDYIAIRPEWTIRRAIEQVRRRGRDSEIISIVYVVDANWKLLDALSIRRLILADLDATVSEIMNNTFISLSAFDDREEAVRSLARYDLVAIPVVDSDGILVGIVTVDDVLDVAEEEATEDFHKAAAVTPLRTSYKETSILWLVRSRIGWLAILVFVNLISAGVIAAYEKTLATIIALSFFIPLLIGSGGNTGAQSATLMVRAIATGDVVGSEWFRILGKELIVGIMLGVVMGILSTFLGFFVGGFYIGLIVGLAMCGIVLVANLLGTVLPFILTKMGLDPAVASSPLITTIADATGLLIYFSIAAAFIRAGLIGTPI